MIKTLILLISAIALNIFYKGTQQEATKLLDGNETFDMQELKINNFSLSGLTKKVLILRFGNPVNIQKVLNEFTGEISYFYIYEGIVFDVNEKGKVILEGITNSKIDVNYKGVNIGVGSSLKVIKELFPNTSKQIENNQINILVKNTSASYLVFFIKEGKIFSLSLNENY